MTTLSRGRPGWLKADAAATGAGRQARWNTLLTGSLKDAAEHVKVPPRARGGLARLLRSGSPLLQRVRSVVRDDGDGSGGVVQYRVRDGADMNAQRTAAAPAAHDDQGCLTGGVG